MEPINTVADLIAALQKLDPQLPVGCPTYGGESPVVGRLGLAVEQLRQGSAELAETMCGRTYWFTLGSGPALYHEQRGGKLETVVVVRG